MPALECENTADVRSVNPVSRPRDVSNWAKNVVPARPVPEIIIWCFDIAALLRLTSDYTVSGHYQTFWTMSRQITKIIKIKLTQPLNFIILEQLDNIPFCVISRFLANITWFLSRTTYWHSMTQSFSSGRSLLPATRLIRSGSGIIWISAVKNSGSGIELWITFTHYLIYHIILKICCRALPRLVMW